MFALDKARVRIHVIVYVDDRIITSNIYSEIDKFKDYLSTCFKYLGIFWYFVGLEVAYSPTEMYLCQHKYSLDIISKTKLLGIKPSTFSLEQNHKLLNDDGGYYG